MIKHIVTSLFDNYSRLSKKIENSNFLIESSWVMFNEDSTKKSLFIFSQNNILTVSINGKVEKSITSWNLLNADTIMLKIDNESYIYKKFFLDNNFLVFQKDNSKEKIVLVNETNFKNKIFFSLEDIKEHLYNTYEKPKIIQAQLKKSASERNKKDMKLFIFIVLFIFLLISINIILLFLLGLLISDPYLVNVYDSDLPNYSFLRKYFTIPIHLITIPITYIIIKKILK